MKEALISIQPKWCELIASGKKTVVISKTAPTIETDMCEEIICSRQDPMSREQLKELLGTDLNRSEMIELIKKHPHLPFAHRLFSHGEYIYSNASGDVYDENGYLFEDWHSEGPGCHAGIRLRIGGAWEHGWRICISEQEKSRKEISL